QDEIDATAVPAGRVRLFLAGADGNDTLLGSPGADTITGGIGNDAVLLEAGNDTFLWNPGDGSDNVGGGPGTDAVILDGSNAAETVNISANGGRVFLSRDAGFLITMDLNDVERLDLNTEGQTDTVTINDLSGTDLKQINLNLASGLGGGDGAADSVIVN